MTLFRLDGLGANGGKRVLCRRSLVVGNDDFSRVTDEVRRGVMESTEFRAGRAEGLRDALEIVEALLAREELKLDLPASYITRTARRTRWQAYRNVASRLRTQLTRTARKTPISAQIDAKLRKLGL